MQISIIPEEKIQQAFDLFLSLRKLNLGIHADRRKFHYRFEIDEHCIEFCVFPLRGAEVLKFIQVWWFDTESRIDELIDIIEEELDAARSHRNEQVGRRD